MLNESGTKAGNHMKNLDSLSSTEKEIYIEITPAISIPSFLTGEIQSKLAYVDERISSAKVSGNKILLGIVTHTPGDKSSFNSRSYQGN